MTGADPLRDLELLIRSRYGIISVDTAEEDRLGAVVAQLAGKLGLPLFDWTRTKGLRNLSQPVDETGLGVYGSGAPAVALDHVEASGVNALYYFHGLGAFLNDPVVAGKLADASEKLRGQNGAVVITGVTALPEPLKASVAAWTLPAPGPQDYLDLVRRVVADLSRSQAVPIRISQEDLNRLLANLRGLTLGEAEKALTRAIVADNALSSDALSEVLAAKRAIIARDGLLEYTPPEATMQDVAGLDGLKGWLAKRREILVEPQRAAQFGLSFPRGILLLGVQGCGKSLCAKAVASGWQLPLLKLDPSGLYDKFIGESEKHFQQAMRTAESVAPVVLWIDEVEKAFAQGSGDDDGGVSQRVLGTFLSWLQDRKGDVFVVATANDISRLPPEFMRKGRFDEIFFVDLPADAAREAILRLHLSKRGKDPASFDLPALVKATQGFSGAEIEQAIVSALYTAFSAGQPLTTAVVLSELAHTVPLSQTMREAIARLREWAQSRAVSAN